MFGFFALKLGVICLLLIAPTAANTYCYRTCSTLDVQLQLSAGLKQHKSNIQVIVAVIKPCATAIPSA